MNSYGYTRIGLISSFSTYKDIDTIRKKNILDSFWNSFYQKLDEANLYYDNQSNNYKYNSEVIKNLEANKSQLPLTDESKIVLQHRIEDLTMFFDENSVFKQSSNLLKLLIGENTITAKEYLKHKKVGLTEDQLSMLNELGPYTLEAIIIHVLGSVFHSLKELPYVRMSTLIEHLDSTAQSQLKLYVSDSKRRVIKQEKKSLSKRDYSIGIGLANYLIDIKLILSKTFFEKSIYMNKGLSYYKTCFCICNFDLRLLPIKLNLPMVCKPEDWNPNVDDIFSTTTTSLFDIKGGYLSGVTGEFYNRFRLLTSHDYNNFYVRFIYTF